ncbi:MAG: PaaI family thioesterase [Acidobacteriota bacterium]
MSVDDAIRTHRAIDRRWSGTPTRLADGAAEVELTTTAAMAADEHGLVHGGFVFSLADHAAMLAVNAPTVVLAKAETRFRAPAAAGVRLRASAQRVDDRARPDRARVEVEVVALDDDDVPSAPVFTGTFHCAVPDAHVLAARRG